MAFGEGGGMAPRLGLAVLAGFALLWFACCARAADTSAAVDSSASIERIKASIVAVGTVQQLRNPAFQFLGTGFVVGDGSLIATNAHVLPTILDSERRESLVAVIPTAEREPRVLELRKVAVDTAHDIALMKLVTGSLRPLQLGNSGKVKEGQQFLFTGFPLGAAVGLYATTHRAMISAISPVAIPTPKAAQLEPETIKRLAEQRFPVFQLDAVAYPGSSGSPLYDATTSEVIGVINMVFVKGGRESALTDPSGIAYAIPVQHLKALLGRVQ
jgi:S1-C subfamily serine protease